jgi:hypothetical protein
MEAQRSPENQPDSSIPHPKRFTRRDFIVLAVGGGALAYAANEWLKRQDYRQGEMIRMFAMRAAPSTFDRFDQRPSMCVVDVKDLANGEEVQIILPVARTKDQERRQNSILNSNLKDDLLVLRNIGALDGARWGQVVTKDGKRVIHAGYEQVEIRRGALRKIREAAETNE